LEVSARRAKINSVFPRTPIGETPRCPTGPSHARLHRGNTHTHQNHMAQTGCPPERPSSCEHSELDGTHDHPDGICLIPMAKGSTCKERIFPVLGGGTAALLSPDFPSSWSACAWDPQSIHLRGFPGAAATCGHRSLPHNSDSLDG